MPEFSVIVPVYNVEKCVGRCIESILSQQETNFELILVNDGSLDKSGEICEQYAIIDSRIKVIHQKNQGVSSARNQGLKAAKAKYIVFVDSDDMVDNNYLSCLAKLEEEIDLVIGNIRYVEIDGTEHEKQYFIEAGKRVLNQETILEMLQSRAVDLAVCKRFKRNIIFDKNIEFSSDLNLSEDTLFVTNYLCYCNSMAYVNDIPYRYYRYNKNTLSGFDKNYIKKAEKANMMIGECLEKCYELIRDTRIWKERCFYIYYHNIFSVLQCREHNVKQRYQLLKSICESSVFKEYVKDLHLYMKKDTRIIYNMIKTKSPLIYIVVWKLIGLLQKGNNRSL